MNKSTCYRSVFISVWVVLSALMFFPSEPFAQVGALVKVDEERWVSLGGGLRTSFESVEDGSANKQNRSSKFDFESFRLYINSQVHKGIQFEFNTQGDSGDNLRVLDAVAKFRFSDDFNLWAGRITTPTGRSNLSGPYFLNVFDFPFAEAYPNLIVGRDEGAVIWGMLNKGRLKYQFGLFEGKVDGSNQGDNLLYSGRVTYNFWDPEPPIYYNSSTYYGALDVLAVGLVGMYQEDGAGTATNAGDFLGWNVDFLMEKRLNHGGVATLEAAYYKYDLEDVSDGTLVQGDSYFVTAAYLFSKQVGWGQFQPFSRFQSFDRDATNSAGSRGTIDRYDIGLNYIIAAHNARVSILYANEDPGPDTFKIGLQLQLF